MGCNYPDDWNTRNLRSKTIKFVEQLQALCDEQGLYVIADEFQADMLTVVDADGKTVVTDFGFEENKYFGCYQELVGERPEDSEAEDVS